MLADERLQDATREIQLNRMDVGQTGSSDITDLTDLLTMVLRSRFDVSARDTVRLWLADRAAVEWQPFCELVERSRLAPLVLYILHEEQLPLQLREAFQVSARSNRLRSVVILSELSSLLSGLESTNLSTIVLKGGALAETVYPRSDTRPLGDIDLLVKPSDLERVHQLLVQSGFRPWAPETHAGAHEAFENEKVYRKPRRVAIEVDVHWSLFDSPYYQNKISMDWFWETSQTMQVDGRSPMRVLGTEAQIIHLCGHLCLHHEGVELFWLHDVAEVVHAHKEVINWATVLDRAREFELILPLRQILNRVAADWRIDIPASVLSKLDSLEPSAQEKRIFAWLTATNPPPAQRLWADIRSLPQWSQRLRFLWSNLLPSPAYMRQRYGVRHSALLPFYYPYRWYRGLRDIS